METYKKPTKKDSSGTPVELEIAEIYLEMGLREDAFAQLKNLVQHYNSLGRKDEALEVLALMAKISPRKENLERKITSLKDRMKLEDGGARINGPEEAALPEASFGEKRKDARSDLGAELNIVQPEGLRESKEIEISEKAWGFAEIFKTLKETRGPSPENPNFNYNVGMVCVEAGLIDDAIEQFQIAYEKKQNVFEAAHLLGLCFKEKSMWEEAHQAFAKALRVDGISEQNILAAKFELGLILKEQGKTEEALDLLGEAITGRSGISQSQRSNQQADIKINEGGKTPAQFCCFREFDRESKTEKSFGLRKKDQKNGKDRREYYCFYLLCSVLLWILQNQFCFNN